MITDLVQAFFFKFSFKITLYEHTGYAGRRKGFTESCPDLLDAGFDSITSSVKCAKGVYV